MKKIKQIKSSKLSRGFFALKTSARLIPKLLNKDINPEEILYSLIGKDVESFVHEVGTLKGSFLKASQLLSSYGEYYFPKEINLILKKVQNHSLVLEWNKIYPLIPESILNKYMIDESALAAASIGQVHKAIDKDSGQEVVLKIQYPGVRKAIDLDIRILKTLLNLSKVIPKKVIMDDIYHEIKNVLEEEMDYPKESEKQYQYKNWIEQFEGYKVPKVYTDITKDNLIISEYINHPTLSDLHSESLTQVKRNIIGQRILKLYFLEVFKGEYIQTDCHPGNYHFDKDNNLYIIDFGACIKFSPNTIKSYQGLIKYLFKKEKEQFFSTLEDINKSNNSGFSFNREDIWDYCQLAIEPLYSEMYDWGKTDLPDRLLKKAKNLIQSVSVDLFIG